MISSNPCNIYLIVGFDSRRKNEEVERGFTKDLRCISEERIEWCQNLNKENWKTLV